MSAVEAMPAVASGPARQVWPVWMLRVNPTVQRRLADPELSDLLERLADLESATGQLATAASDDLYRMVPTVPEALRGRLLALRRNIHNDRARSGQARTDLPFELPGSVARWVEHHRRRSSLEARIRDAYTDVLGRERGVLRDRLGDTNFLTTLADSAPGVYNDACRYRRRAVADVKDRKAERALVQYLTRAMMRTSPYGRFTAVGLAEPHPSGTPMDEVTSAGATSHVEVDRAVFDYLVAGLLGDSVSGDADPLVLLPPTAQVSDERITFFQMQGSAMRHLSAPMGGPTRVLVELLTLGPRRRSFLIALMAERLGIATPAAEAVLGQAVRLGLVATAWRGDEFVAEPVRQAECDLAQGSVEQARPCLRQLQRDLDRLGDRDGDAIAVRRQLATSAQELSRLGRRPATLSVHEDFIVDPLRVDPGAYRPALDDLAAVTEFLSAFDRMHTVRALLAAALVERFGPGCRVALVAHAEALVRMVYRAERLLGERPDAAIGPVDGSLAMLAKVRHEALATIGRALAGSRHREISWSPGELSELVAGVPDRFRADPASYGLVVQPHTGDLVLNDAYAGHGPMVSRFLHADQARGGDAIARLRTRLAALYGPDVRLVEDKGTYGRSINAHPPIIDEPADPERWSRLQLHHDAATDAVEIVDDDGAVVKVLALGAQLPELFPYPVRLATWLCSSGRVLLDLPGGVGPHPPCPTTIAYPRIRVGRVILSRRRWYLGRDFPVADAPGDDADYLLALTRWRAAHAVPPEVMLKSVFDGPTAWENLSAEGSRERFLELRRQSKPQYVDLHSAVMARILPRLMQRRPPGYVEEALPAVADGGHALEWMVELARPAHAAGFGWRQVERAAP